MCVHASHIDLISAQTDLGLCFKYSRKRVALPGYARLIAGVGDRRGA